MSRQLTPTTMLDRLSNRYVGFDDLFDELSSFLTYDPRRPGMVSDQNRFPPYNIEKLDEDNYEISLAVAGFKKEELNVELENNVLRVTGSKSVQEAENKATMLYRGIAERSFTRTFKLGEFIEVGNVELQDGILSISLYRHIPENMKPKKIEIK